MSTRITGCLHLYCVLKNCSRQQLVVKKILRNKNNLEIFIDEIAQQFKVVTIVNLCPV